MISLDGCWAKEDSASCGGIFLSIGRKIPLCCSSANRERQLRSSQLGGGIGDWLY